jgi:hypothetical protein
MTPRPNGSLIPARARRQAYGILFVVAAVRCIFRILPSFIPNFGVALTPEALILEFAIIAVFVGLGLWAVLRPLFPSFLGLILYVGLSMPALVVNPASIIQNYGATAIKIILVFFLIRAVGTAIKAQKASRCSPVN